VTFPNFVKYLFWGSAENKGLFEDTSSPSSIFGGVVSTSAVNDEKRKKLSKY
jgi:hypothetical protein